MLIDLFKQHLLILFISNCHAHIALGGIPICDNYYFNIDSIYIVFLEIPDIDLNEILTLTVLQYAVQWHTWSVMLKRWKVLLGLTVI